MNSQQFTEKSRAALNDAQQMTVEYQNQEVTQEHLLRALLSDPQGLIPQLLQKMGKDTGLLDTRLETLIQRIPKVMGSGREPDKIYIGSDVERALVAAREAAQQMKDEYISVEHIFLGLLRKPSPSLKQLWTDLHVDDRAFLAAL